MNFRTQYSEPRRVQHEDSGEIITSQAFAKECLISSILKKYQDLGADPMDLMPPPTYADLSAVPSYEETLQRIADFQDYFMSLKAEVRQQFDNNPAVLVDWLSDPKNYDEAVKQGFIKGKPVEPVKQVQENPKTEGKPSDSEPVV